MQLAGYRAFEPAPLPPNPPLLLTGELLRHFSLADQAVGRLDGVVGILPNPDLFVAMYVKQEAVLSSQIEGTQASLTDVVQFEAEEGEEAGNIDVAEVVNYVGAMGKGLERLKEFPLSLRLIREIHAELMKGVRGSEKSPGEFRTTQNWVGPAGSNLNNALFVPPPPHLVPQVLGQFETFLHDDSLPPLVHAGLAHAQFETIHPFLDGNGRMGRLLITFLLCQREVLARPLLYLSVYLKRHRAEYYDRLQAVRVSGDWEQWLLFFLRGIQEVAREASVTARRILELRERFRDQLGKQGKASGNLQRALDVLFAHPAVTSASLARELEVNYVTANVIASKLSALGVLHESTGYKRNRRFLFKPYLDLFSESAPNDATDNTQAEVARPESGE
jgi:Fic family protein